MIALLLATLLPIAAARQQPQGTTLEVLGLVTVPSGDFRSSSDDEGFAVQDQTGGIWVSVKKNPKLAAGKRVRVSGALATSAGKLQINATSIEPLPGSLLRVDTGQVGAATLGHIITIEGTITQAPANDLPYGWKMLVDDGSGPAQVYLNKSTDIRANAPELQKGKRIRVTGFGNQYDTTYEVDPRDQKDLVALPPK